MKRLMLIMMLVTICLNSVALAQVKQDKSKRTLTGHSGKVVAVSFSPDGKTVASGSEDKTVRIWDVVTGQLKRTLTGHTDEVTSVCFSPDGKTLASGSADKTVKL